MSPLQRFEHADWTLVPHLLHRDLERWLTDGMRPKSLFLGRMLSNDLIGAVECARPIECAGLVNIALFLIAECPRESFGSRAHYEQWNRLGGLRGLRDTDTSKIYEHLWRGRLWKPGKEDDDD